MYLFLPLALPLSLLTIIIAPGSAQTPQNAGAELKPAGDAAAAAKVLPDTIRIEHQS
jgi:hypothetical protein